MAEKGAVVVSSLSLLWLTVPVQCRSCLCRQGTVVVGEPWLLDLVDLELLGCLIDEESLLTLPVALLRCFVDHR